jgi:hypothetical protein
MSRRYTSKLKKILSQIKQSNGQATLDSMFDAPARAWLIRQSQNVQENQHLLDAFEIMVSTFGGDILQTSRIRIANQSYVSVDVVFKDIVAMENFKFIFNDPNYIELPESKIDN